jgi:hypothetical protein
MSAFTSYLEGKIVDHFLRGVAVPVPAGLYLGLLETGINGQFETTYPSYTRQQSYWAAIDANGEAKNTNGLLFPLSTSLSTSVTVAHIGLFDSPSGGNMLIKSPLAEPKTINPGTALWFSAGSIVLFSPYWAPPNPAFVTSRARGAGWETAFGGRLVAPLEQTIEVATRSQIKSLNIITEGGSGSCVVDLRRSVKPFLPSAAGSVCGAAKPTIAAATNLFLDSFPGWTSTTFEAGDLLAFHLESSSVFTKLDVQIILEDIA